MFYKRFLVKTPLKWHSEFKVHNLDPSDVAKTLIDGKGVLFIVRRSTLMDEDSYIGDNSYYEKCSDSAENGPRCISAYEYYDYIRENKKHGSSLLEMKQYPFRYDGKSFALDIYEGKLKGLVILNQRSLGELKLPVFFDIGDEITNKEVYSNYNLAHWNDANIEGHINDDNNQTNIQRTKVSAVYKESQYFQTDENSSEDIPPDRII